MRRNWITGHSVQKPKRGRGVDQRDVGERLGIVAQQASRLRIELLGEQAELVRPAGHVVEQLAGLVVPAVQGEGLDQPVRAREERSLLSLERVVLQISVDEVRSAELLADGVDRAGDPGVVARQEPHHGDLQERRIQLRASVPLGGGDPVLVRLHQDVGDEAGPDLLGIGVLRDELVRNAVAHQPREDLLKTLLCILRPLLAVRRGGAIDRHRNRHPELAFFRSNAGDGVCPCAEGFGFGKDDPRDRK